MNLAPLIALLADLVADDGWPWQDWNADPRAAFMRLFYDLNERASRGANQLVWRIEFRRVMPNASLTGAKPAGEASGRSDS